MKISLRRRLALWYAVAMPALIFALVFTAQHIMVGTMRTDLDGSLQNGAEMVVNAITPILQGSGETYRQAIKQLADEEPTEIPSLIRISDPNFNILAKYGSVPDAIVPSLNRLLESLQGKTEHFDSVAIRGTEALRLYTCTVRDPSTGEVVALVQVGGGLSHVTSAQNRLLLYTLIEGSAGSLVTVALGILILRRGLRPLDRILDRVQQIESKNLQAGLPQEPRPPELQELADSLNSMWQRLDESITRREAFIASASHDIRTPLTVLQGQIEVLLMQPSIDREAKQSLAKMHREIRRLVRMTNNMLLNAQLESKPTFAHDEVNLRPLVEEIVGETAVLARDLDLGLSASEDVMVRGDPDLLKEMVLNVVDNALKFTPAGGRVDLSVKQEDDWGVIEVSDSGTGIPQERLPHIAQPYLKIDDRQGSTRQGAGLGLAIVRQIVAMHRGHMEIRSQVGVGTTVRIRLPITPGVDRKTPGQATEANTSGQT